ncbi:MAG: DUF2752 domain-containing protein [Planctomycetota bacterium]
MPDVRPAASPPDLPPQSSAPPPAQPRPWRFRAWFWLSLSGLSLLAGILANVEPDGATWFGLRGPRCPVGTGLGEHACPGCGLVRATSATLQGRPADAWEFHPAGLAVAALLVGTFSVHLDIIRRGLEAPFHRRLQRLGYLSFAFAVLAGYALRWLRHL